MNGDKLPPGQKVRLLGVDYDRLILPAGDELFVTQFGWSYLRHLLPENWYQDQWYLQQGTRLPDSTGQVYRVSTRAVAGRSLELVVKFSRVGQEVPLEVATSFPDKITPEDMANARFNSPMEEFGLVMEMRRGLRGSRDGRLLAQRPLAIFVPSQEFEVWQLGRSHSSFYAHQQLLYENQENGESAIELDIRREYVMLYGWIKGINAEQACVACDINEQELYALTQRVIGDLSAKGFRVLDNKPKHFIVRQRHGDGKLMRRSGKISYALVDFELLQRTPEYEQQFKYDRRVRYWQLQSHRLESPAAPLPPQLKRMEIFGVSYLYGKAPNGGRLWVVGSDPELFDFFLPDRWRRTPRVKLAVTSEVYRTRTRDNIHVVYRRSRVGERPYVDPFYEQGKRIREQGYNSPFEEVAIAESLRRVGIPTAYPRAIYRTSHQSAKAGYLHDERRYNTHAALVTPQPEREPVLSSRHDYFTIWGHYRGVDPHKYYRPQGHWGFIDAEKAFADGLLTDPEFHQLVATTRRQIASLGLSQVIMDDYQFILLFDEQGILRRDSSGAPEVVWSIDALTAFEYKLLDESTYRGIVAAEKSKLKAAGCEAFILGGNHLLLTMKPDGQIRTDSTGEYETILCNFELLHHDPANQAIGSRP